MQLAPTTNETGTNTNCIVHGYPVCPYAYRYFDVTFEQNSKTVKVKPMGRQNEIGFLFTVHENRETGALLIVERQVGVVKM
jgi:hypothetical protein